MKHNCPECGVQEGMLHRPSCPVLAAGEPKIGPNRGNAGKGRPKGAVNKTTKAAKEAIAEAFETMGGVPALVAWADQNDDHRKVFYSQIWPKIVPLQVGGDADNPLNVVTEIRRTIVDPRHTDS